MKDVVSVQNMRKSDAACIASGVPGEELMRRAGEGIFRAVGEAGWKAPVAIVCGKGNNAGDGYVVALLLREAGIPCDLLLQERTFSADGGIWFRRCEAAGIPVRLWEETEDLSPWGTVLDCVFGTGFHGPVTGPAARMIRLINRSGAFVISADINSGLNGDSGLAELAVQSDLTVSVGSWKTGHFLNMAKDLMRAKVNCDIGIPPVDRVYHLAEAEDIRPLFQPRKNQSNKGTWGYLALVGGSLPYSGAIRLAEMASAAMRSGAGVVRIGCPRSLCPLLVPSILESTLFPLSDNGESVLFRPEEFRELIRGIRVLAFGMGVTHTEETRKALAWLLENHAGILILDADGLNALAALGPERLRTAAGPVILTPHPGEFARLTGRSIPEVLASSIPLAEEFAAAHGVILLLKGTSTVITDGQDTRIVDRGCAGMGTAGSGDVLSGILAALCAARPEDLLNAVTAAAWVNGRAGEIAQARMGDLSMIASDTVQALPEVIREIRSVPAPPDSDPSRKSPYE